MGNRVAIISFPKNKLEIFILAIFSLVYSLSFGATLPATDVRFYRPFESQVQGQAMPVIVAKRVGVCMTHSHLDHRSDAWECVSENQTFDPCFIKTYVKSKEAVCPMSPLEGQAVQINFSAQKPLPDNKTNKQDTLDMSTDDPWAILLKNGAYCVKLPPEKIFSVNGQRVKYHCDDQGYLLGHIQRCDLMWKMLFLPTRESNHLRNVEMDAVWY